MFEVTERNVLVANVNFRAEKHGDENKTAVDIKIELDAHKSSLKHFDSSLPDFLYREPATGEQQRLDVEPDEADSSDKRTSLRVPKIGALKWDEKFPGYTLTIEGGMGLKKPLVLVVELSKFAFEPKEGGSVVITFNATAHPNPKESAALVEMIQEEVELTLTAPKADAQQAAQADLADAASDRKKVLIVAVDFTQKKDLTIASVTASDGYPIICDPVPYKPTQEQVTDLLRFKGYEPEFTPAIVAEVWPKAA
jgi:hypothetical protein